MRDTLDVNTIHGQMLKLVERLRKQEKLPPVRLIMKKVSGVQGKYDKNPSPTIHYWPEDLTYAIIVGIVLHELGHHWVAFAHQPKRKKRIPLVWEEFLAERFALLVMSKLFPNLCRSYVMECIAGLDAVKKTSTRHFLACSTAYLAYLNRML